MAKSENWIRRFEGCLTDCVAYYFNEHPSNVPIFIYPRRDWPRKLIKYFAKRGYDISEVACDGPPKRGRHIMVLNGHGKKEVYGGDAHAVIYEKGKLAYDPNWPWNRKKSLITHRLVIKKIKK